MTIVNLTPHEVVIRDPDEVTTVYPPSGMVARVRENVEGESSLHDHRQVVVHLGGLAGLPGPSEGVTYIVSMPCAMALAAAGLHRPDVVYPHHQYRDDAGNILGADQLARIGAVWEL